MMGEGAVVTTTRCGGHYQSAIKQGNRAGLVLLVDESAMFCQGARKAVIRFDHKLELPPTVMEGEGARPRLCAESQ